MGLDLIVEGCPRPGHEAEWQRTIERTFRDEELSDQDKARFAEISIPAYERVGAPRVGYDPAADAWIIEARQARTSDDIATTLKAFHGYYVLRLAASDGVPEYSHGGLYDGVDETSFRGDFLSGCDRVLHKSLIDQAWDHKLPQASIDYGGALLSAADAAAEGPALEEPAPKRGLLARFGLGGKAAEPVAFEEQLRIVRAAGRWFVFWGERGHAIRAWS